MASAASSALRQGALAAVGSQQLDNVAVFGRGAVYR
jgi:hypothetical protein